MSTNRIREELLERYLLEGQSENDMYKSVAEKYSSNEDHKARIYNYMKNKYFMPSTPILISGNKNVGYPISCFVNEFQDTIDSIIDVWTENAHIGANGGGIGTYVGNLRSMGEKISKGGETSGIIPFIKVIDEIAKTINQGAHRRGAAAVYLNISHPEINEFISMRRHNKGDINRMMHHLHHGVIISDEFMQAVQKGEMWNLISPHSGNVTEQVYARTLWQNLLTTRVETGEPYIVFIDNVNRAIPQEHKDKNLFVKTSNLCSEITLHTGIDHLDNIRTAICCLASINLAKLNEFHGNLKQMSYDICLFLDNVLSDFENNACEKFKNAIYSVKRERSIGVGVMGFHTYLQDNLIPINSKEAREFNISIFRELDQYLAEASLQIGKERGPCLDSEKYRFMNVSAIAPTASISILCDRCSEGVNLKPSNMYTHSNVAGVFIEKNPALENLLIKKSANTEEIWKSIASKQGSVQHLTSTLSDLEREVFKTAYEIDQMSNIQLAIDRTPYIDQAQSLNLFLPANVNVKEINAMHMHAWKGGLKTLYYTRSMSIQRAEQILPDCSSCS